MAPVNAYGRDHPISGLALAIAVGMAGFCVLIGIVDLTSFASVFASPTHARVRLVTGLSVMVILVAVSETWARLPQFRRPLTMLVRAASLVGGLATLTALLAAP